MNLQAQFQEAIKAAEAALTAGNLDEARGHRERAESFKAQIAEWAAISGLSDDVKKMAPARPPLPGTEVGGEVQQVEDKQPQESPLVRAAYINRLGTPEQEIDQILTDLHGAQYANKFWQQKASFNRYMRHGEVALSTDDRALLKTVIFTPGSVKSALLQGVDSVGSLKTTMVEAADSLGGYTVPIDTQSRIVAKLKGFTVVRGRASTMNTSRDRVEMPRMIDQGGDTTDRYTSPVRVRWVDETPNALEAQNLTFGMLGISVHTSMVEAFLSRNLLEDSAFPLEDYLVEKFGEAAAFDEDDQFFFGNGVGKPQGMLPSFANSLSLAEIASGTNSSPFFLWDQLLSVAYSIPRQYRQNSAWFMNRHTVLKIHQLKNPTTSEYYWRNYNETGGDAGPQSTLLGYPIEEQEQFPDVANGSYPILFGDLKSYQIVDRVGMTVERYVDSYTARQNLVCFVMRRRVGGQLLEPWRLVTVKGANA